MSETKVLTILVAITLVLTAVNTVGIFMPSSVAVTGNVAAGPAAAGQPARVQVSVDDDPSIGSADAPVTIIEFSDFQCPFCRRFYTQTLSQIEEQYVNTGKVRLVYRDFPLTSIHPSAMAAAEAGECADEQGKFWEYHNKIFDEQAKQGEGTVNFGTNDLKQWAVDIGLNAEQFNSCLDTGKYASEVQKDEADGQSAGVSGTPAFFINGQILEGAYPFAAFQQIIESELSS